MLPGLGRAGTGMGMGEPAARLLRLGERYFEAGLQLNPIEGSYALGEARFEDKLAIDIAPRALARDRALQRWLLRELARLPEAGLGEQERLSLALLRHQARTRLATLAFPEALLPLDQSGGLPVLLAQFAGGESVQPFRTPRNYENFLRRLSRLPAWNRQAVLNMRRGLSLGISMPQPLVERCLESLQPLLEREPTEHPFYQPLKRLPAGFSPAQRQRLAQQYQREIRRHLLPSLRGLADFLREEYLPRARTTAGLSALPGGAAWYAQAIRLHTSSALEAEAIHQLGLAEVARIRAEMRQIQAHYGHSGELSDFLLSHPQRPEFRPFQSEQEVLDAYAALNRKIEARLPALFHRRPRTSLEIVAAPELGRDSASDHYLAPAADGSRPGAFVAVIMDPRAYSSTGMATLLLHEGQPGHHYHLALQQELPLPSFRKFYALTAFEEGWALYAETLGHELGLFEDPNARLGHLSDELLRAVRLVVDTGLHARGWSREQSMRYIQDMQGYSELEARRATERYMAYPGQALGYKIGALKIRELRERAQSRLGLRFSLADFHQQILSDGALPLDLLEAKIERWLAQQPAP